jgi:nucleotide-binding universal stress UspA family protein
MHGDDAPVVVGADGSAAGLAAVRTAAAEATALGVALRVVHAFAWPLHAPQRAYPDLREEAAAVLERAVLAATRTAPGLTIEARLVDGAPVRVLLHAGRSAGLLVLGDDAEVPAAAVPLDSVLLQVVARSWRPVLIARAGGAAEGPVVAAVDASPAGGVVLRHAAAYAGRAGAPLTVLHVAEPGADPEQAAAALAAALGEPPPGHAGPPRVVTGDPATELVRAAAGARRLVVGARGGGAGHGTLLGGVAHAVIRHAACPVVVVHGPAHRR